jgi:hypothetical protein
LVTLAAVALLTVVLALMKNEYKWLYLGVALLFVYVFRPGSAVHSFTFEKKSVDKTALAVLVAVITICACVLPMDELPLWNGEQPGHRNQYELMAESILEGRIDFNYGDEDNLAGLENPYDPDERDEAGVRYHWDHAYYDGHYYMYFGIVPVFLVFLPYRVLTGTSLTTFHATQLFAALIIAGIFVLFNLLAKTFFKKLPYGVYIALSVAFSVMSVWYSTAEPALYCTAITAAIALEVWSLYFFVRAVWAEKKENVQIAYAAVGALLGALAFGCRPPIALANILVIPMLVAFLKQRKFSFKLLGKLALAALPYVFVGVALMCYNYARFDDPFEFGQAYQLTVADQHLYSITLDSKTIVRIINDSAKHFFAIGEIKETFPYVKASSVFFNFPILLLCLAILRTGVIKNMKKATILPFVIGLLVSVVLITAVDIMWAPYLLERYSMDIYFLMGIACFIIIGFWYEDCAEKNRKYFSSAMMILAGITTVATFLLCIRTIGAYYPEKITEMAERLRLLS